MSHRALVAGGLVAAAGTVFNAQSQAVDRRRQVGARWSSIIMDPSRSFLSSARCRANLF